MRRGDTRRAHLVKKIDVHPIIMVSDVDVAANILLECFTDILRNFVAETVILEVQTAFREAAISEVKSQYTKFEEKLNVDSAGNMEQVRLYFCHINTHDVYLAFARQLEITNPEVAQVIRIRADSVSNKHTDSVQVVTLGPVLWQASSSKYGMQSMRDIRQSSDVHLRKILELFVTRGIDEALMQGNVLS